MQMNMAISQNFVGFVNAFVRWVAAWAVFYIDIGGELELFLFGKFVFERGRGKVFFWLWEGLRLLSTFVHGWT